MLAPSARSRAGQRRAAPELEDGWHAGDAGTWSRKAAPSPGRDGDIRCRHERRHGGLIVLRRKGVPHFDEVGGKDDLPIRDAANRDFSVLYDRVDAELGPVDELLDDRLRRSRKGERRLYCDWNVGCAIDAPDPASSHVIDRFDDRRQSHDSGRGLPLPRLGAH